MLKRKPLIFLILLAIVVVFSAAEALAVWPDAPSMFSDPPDYVLINAGKNGKWEINASIVEDATCTPDIGSEFPCIKYNLNVRRKDTTCNTSGLGAVIVTRPYDDSCTIAFDVVWKPGDLKFEPDQKAFPNTPGWEWDSVSSCPLEIGINSADVTTGTVCLKINSRYYCEDMLVPTCEIPECEAPPAGGVAASVQTCVNNYGDTNDLTDDAHYWFFRESDAQGCIDPVETFQMCSGLCPRTYLDETGKCTTLTPSQSEEHIVASGLQGQKCDDEAVNTTFNIGDHYLYEVWSGGYFWQGCLNLSTYAWDSLYCCSAPNACP